jgi:hypothetical protein
MIELGANDTMWADKAAVAALDADIRFPDGHFVGYISLFPFGGAAGVGAICRQHAHWQIISPAFHHHGGHFPNEQRRFGGYCRRYFLAAGYLGRNSNRMQIGQCSIHGTEILLNDGLSLFGISFLDGLFNPADFRKLRLSCEPYAISPMTTSG